MSRTWRRFLRCQAGDIAVEYNVIAAGIAVVALVAVLGAAKVIGNVVFKDVIITLGQSPYDDVPVSSSDTTTASQDGGETHAASSEPAAPDAANGGGQEQDPVAGPQPCGRC